MAKWILGLMLASLASLAHAQDTRQHFAVAPTQPAELFPLSAVRLLSESQLSAAVNANREYLLALEPDRLLAPFLREAGLKPKAESYGNWESSGLDGHTGGHYLSALSLMVAAGADTSDGELNRRLDYMLDELERCQNADGGGYIGGVPGSRELWTKVAAGDTGAVWKKWVPWYNVHKSFAGLRDAYLVANKEKGRKLLVRLGDWCVRVTADLSDDQMQSMLNNEYGGMNEVMADIYSITGDKKYLKTAARFNHRAVFDPLIAHQDRLTGLHANTQIPKIIGMERIAALIGDPREHDGARFFWDTVSKNRCVAFGGNSVREHFHPSDNFIELLKDREGPETCNTYNMLRLTEQLFTADPKAVYADFYERAFFNHIISAINLDKPGYVYFTPIRPQHYRVYSQPENCFWCCVGTGMENPGRYGQFIYAKANDGVYVNLFIASELQVNDRFAIRQQTAFPYESVTRLEMKLKQPQELTLYLRHPEWVKTRQLTVKVNGQPVAVESTPSSYAAVRRLWKQGDVVEVQLPMHTRAERLPDGSDWVALLHGPIVLASPTGTKDLPGSFADGARMGHVANGPMVPLDEVPVFFATDQELPRHVVRDPSGKPLHFRVKDVVSPDSPGGISLKPFLSLHEQRYQMYFELTSPEKMSALKEQRAEEDRTRATREAATIDQITIGEQQPEVEHDFKGEDTETGMHEGRKWRHGSIIQYTLNTRGEKAAELEVTYWGGDSGRAFDIFAGGTKIASQELTGDQPGKFISIRYPIPAMAFADAKDHTLTVKFIATKWLAGGLYDVRLMKPTR